MARFTFSFFVVVAVASGRTASTLAREPLATAWRQGSSEGNS